MLNKIIGLFKSKTAQPAYRVSNHAIKRYSVLCPLSASKCKDNEEIKYKIIRAAQLGQVLDIRKNSTYVIGYYKNQIVVHKDEIVDVWKSDRFRLVEVDESLKKKYGKVSKLA